MSEHVSYETRDGVAIITIDNPPVNALSHSVRKGLWDAVERAGTDADVGAVLIRADGRTFPAGADVREFGKKPLKPILTTLCDRIEACPKPVVAAIHGTALGGGFEIALASHYRVASSDALVGLPEVTLGVLPGAGGTQRVPRITGAGPALAIMVSGNRVSADAASQVGLIDRVVEGDLQKAAFRLARKLARRKAAPRPTGKRRRGFADPAAYLAQVAEWRKKTADRPVEAAARIVDCVEAALLMPLENGLALERAAFEDCVSSDQAKSLRHAFFAERRAAKVPELAGATLREVNTIGVVGAGLMGAGIAVSFLDAGFPVTLVERDDEKLLQGVERIDTLYERAIAKKRITGDIRDARMQHLHGTTNMAELKHTDLVIEAVFEDETAKREIFAALDNVMKPGAVLATNTSYLDVDALAATVSRPADVIGLHFFSPANIMKLLEIVVGKATDPNVVATGFHLAKRLGKVPVRAGVGDGFIGNRVLTAYRMAADFMLEDGATPGQIDAAMRSFGFPLGPYQVLDMAGLDISWARRKRLAPTRDPKARYVDIGDVMCERGWLGQKTGRGYYRYDTSKNFGIDDLDVLDLIDEQRAQKGITARKFSATEIQQRCLYAMANEGARLLGDGIALRPSDIDVVMIYGFGFPRWRGGPMINADLHGLLEVENELRTYAEQDALFWTPSPLFDELIKNGQNFGTLNER